MGHCKARARPGHAGERHAGRPAGGNRVLTGSVSVGAVRHVSPPAPRKALARSVAAAVLISAALGGAALAALARPDARVTPPLAIDLRPRAVAGSEPLAVQAAVAVRFALPAFNAATIDDRRWQAPTAFDPSGSGRFMLAPHALALPAAGNRFEPSVVALGHDRFQPVAAPTVADAGEAPVVVASLDPGIALPDAGVAPASAIEAIETLTLPQSGPLPALRPGEARPAPKPASAKPAPTTELAYAAPDDPQEDRGRGLLDGFRGLLNRSKLPGPGSGIAVYDIRGKIVYMPNGQRLEAHSGLGPMQDDPRYVHVKMKGPTPPNVYNLRMREALFHGVEAIRLLPMNQELMRGRDGMLAHTYLLGNTKSSNGCLSFEHYEKFLAAFKRGEVKKLVVVPDLSHLPTYMAMLEPDGATGVKVAGVAPQPRARAYDPTPR